MKSKNKFIKVDYFNLLILLLFFLFIIYFLVGDKYLLGSTTDWSSQHIMFPEYFRTLFYKTKDLFPDFAFNLGAGQNIYNFAYYGLLSPIILFSYLLPHVNMTTYIMISTAFIVYLSVVLMYKLLKSHNYNSTICFIVSFIFMCASPLIFHLHRHIMFINYMPFLILGFMGVDKYFNDSKSWLLLFSTFLMIMTSYYFSVVGIIVLVIYGIYIYIKKNTKITFKNFIKDGIRFLIPILIGVLLSGILIVPTLMVILSGRSATTVSISLKDILIPGVHIDYALYKHYGIGLGAIVIFSLVHLITEKREYKWLGIILFLILIFPLFNYIFNATMYIDSKSLIPFLPLYVLTIAHFLKSLFNKEILIKPLFIITLIVFILGIGSCGRYKYALIIDAVICYIAIYSCYKKGYKNYIGALLCLISIIIALTTSKIDHLTLKEMIYGKDYTYQKELINKVTNEDNNIYRISNQITPGENVNRSYNNIKFYQTTLYSSTYNLEYNKFYYDIMNNPIQSRNRVITSSAKNYPFLILMNHKYLITKENPYLGYKEYASLGNIKVYKNEDVMPLGYSSKNILSSDNFEKLGYPYNQEAILKNIIVDKSDNDNFISNVLPYNIKISNLEEALNKLNVTKENGTYTFNIEKTTSIILDLEEEINNKILYIRFKMKKANSCEIGDSQIIINGVSNKLTCNPWKYHNKNYDFDYTIATDNISSLKITFTKGNYEIEDIKFYTLDYNEIKNIKDNVDEFKFDQESTKGDIIEGNIDVSNDGYFVLSIPYDKGYEIYVDNQKTEYEKVNASLLGFKITAGSHHVKIKYSAPGKKQGKYISITGIFLTIGLISYEEIKKKKIK